MTTNDAPIEHIILGVDDGDFSWETVDAARQLATQVGAEFHTFHATTDKRPEDLAARAADANVTVRSAVTYPGPEGVARGLVDHTAEFDNAVVALTSHARRGLTSSLVGSSASALLSLSTDPLLLYGPHHEATGAISRVMACVDGSELSETILPAACRWAGAADVPLWLVQVIDPTGAATHADTNYLKRVAEQIDTEGLDLNFDDLHGDHPGRSIADFADVEDGTLTALATHGRSGLRSITMGSVATEVTRRAKGPTLIRRPQ